MADRYRAILIGNSSYPVDEHNLPPLIGPRNDIVALRDALQDPGQGLFGPGSVTLQPDGSMQEVLVGLDEFFTTAGRDEVLLLYYSGHGRLDEYGNLYLCTRDTRADRLRSTSISSRAVDGIIEGSAASRVIIMLDCCHSGAFKGADMVRAFEGTGRYVLTSCRAQELANDASAEDGTSLFTGQVVAGLRTAPAARSTAGHLTLEELFEFTRNGLAELGRQRPQFKADGEGGLAIARRRARPTRPAAPTLHVSEVRLDLGQVEAGETLPAERVYVEARDSEGAPAPWTVECDADWIATSRHMEPERLELLVTPRAGHSRANVHVRNAATGESRTIRLHLQVQPAPGPSRPPAAGPDLVKAAELAQRKFAQQATDRKKVAQLEHLITLGWAIPLKPGADPAPELPAGAVQTARNRNPGPRPVADTRSRSALGGPVRYIRDRIDGLPRTFRARRPGSGYARDQADRLFREIVEAIDQRRPLPFSADDLLKIKFAREPNGYIETEVDAALKKTADMLRQQVMVQYHVKCTADMNHMISRISGLRASLRRCRSGDGYDPAEVDNLFQMILDFRAGASPLPMPVEQLDRVHFTVVPGGYSEAEVGAALQKIKGMLR
ncbi:caspase, EACC1-associated type [Paractinoplanes durhamensis]|uniref:Peptidase C14 caspase domain-containing protein n=1 Tax=Paractinoplanes durhamensis TaxID=113563 RepID=A0ABQ3YT81_9ACTN|nr:caspase family protein [Actinoplanes durhamensis]GIE00742.1 hypothetical protein Adu01nite_20920 [Actinoplanes durhamensis]